MKLKLILISLLLFTLFTGLLIYKIPYVSGAINMNHTTENGLHLVRITANDLSVPFFGAAFHLYYDPALYTFDHYETGNYFKDDNINPLIIVENADDTLVTGISLKRGEIINKKDGTLIDLYFKQIPPDIFYPFNAPETPSGANNQDKSFSLSQGIFSTYSNGRMNIPEIIFNSD